MTTMLRFLRPVALAAATVLLLALGSCWLFPMPEGWYDFFTKGAPTSFYDDCELEYNGHSGRYLYVPEATLSTTWYRSDSHSIELKAGQTVRTIIDAPEPTYFYFALNTWGGSFLDVWIDDSPVEPVSVSGGVHRVEYPAGEHTIRFANGGSNEWDSLFLDDLRLGSPPPCLYVANPSQNQIVRFDGMNGAGRVTYGYWGTFSAPVDVDLDHDGRIYVVERDGCRIDRIDDMSGAGWVSFGSYGSDACQFAYPRSIAFDSRGRIYVCDTGNKRIVRLDDMSGSGWAAFGSYGWGTGRFVEPDHIAIDAEDRIYVSDVGAGRIVRVDDMTGAGWVEFGLWGQSVSICNDGKLLIADPNNNRIVRIDDMTGAGWVALSSYDVYSFNDPLDATMGIDGKIYVADEWDARIVCIDDMKGKNWETCDLDEYGGGSIPSSVVFK